PPSPAPLLFTLSLHVALPIYGRCTHYFRNANTGRYELIPVDDTCRILSDQLGKTPLLWITCELKCGLCAQAVGNSRAAYTQYPRSEEHTSELQSRFDLVCRLL